MAPVGINRPGYSSPRTPTGIQRPGYSSAPTPRPSRASFSAPTGVYRPGRSPSQGGGGISPLQQTREKFFDNRYDVSTDRLRRRRQQEEQLKLFKDMYTKPVSGATGLVQMTQDAPMSLADYTMKLGRELGPTPREIMSDVSYAAKSMGQGLLEKGTPMMNLAKSLFGGVQNLFTGASQPQNFLQNFQQMAGKVFNPGDIAARLQSATPEARRLYAQYMQQGMPYQQAFEMATGQRFANGGIATLN